MTDATKKIDGKVYRFLEDASRILLCSDCRKDMPQYRDAPTGYVSPESSEFRIVGIGGHQGIEALEKPVCVPCYFQAFQRTYPEAPLPKMNEYVWDK